ncbi:ChbG/HpnK family deacetylase, partial [candidate division GN15 bacterium]|nr:ChbG/HpnK family deacetylase [candidate division GN15 bacterium]
VRSACINISHLDSHFHAHTHPGLFLTLKAVQKAHKIGRVRLTKNVYDVDAPVDNNFLRFKKRLWNVGLRRYIATGTTSGFTEFSTFLAIASRTTLRHETLELMVHPGHPEYEQETAELGTRWQTGLQQPITLISYHEV